MRFRVGVKDVFLHVRAFHDGYFPQYALFLLGAVLNVLLYFRVLPIPGDLVMVLALFIAVGTTVLAFSILPHRQRRGEFFERAFKVHSAEHIPAKAMLELGAAARELGLTRHERISLDDRAKRRALGPPEGRGRPRDPLPPRDSPLWGRAAEFYHWDPQRNVLFVRFKPHGPMNDEEAWAIADIIRTNVADARGYTLALDAAHNRCPQ